jgi:hypothetical protein
MSESESSNDTVLFDNENTTILNNDLNQIIDHEFMISLKSYFEQNDDQFEEDQENIGLGLSNKNVRIIKNIINFLKSNNKTNNEIKDAIILLYPNNDDVKYLLDRLLNPLISFTQNLLNIFNPNMISILDSVQQEHTDQYTGDIINPSLLLNTFNQNINIFTYPTIPVNPIIPFESHDINIPNFYTNIIYSSIILPNPTLNQSPSYTDVKNVVTDEILDENTQKLLFKNLDSNLKINYKTCSICIDDYDDESEIRQLKCNHIYHITCIDPWLLKESYKCPLCRNDTLPHEHK